MGMSNTHTQRSRERRWKTKSASLSSGYETKVETVRDHFCGYFYLCCFYFVLYI